MKKIILLSALLIFACSSDSEGNDCIYEPTLSTEAVTDITATSATLNGVISIVSENCEVALGEMQGFVYSTNPSPTNDDNVEVVYGTDISTTIDNLSPNTTYYVRVFITNSLGEFYGNEIDFTTEDNGGEPADCDVVYLDENGVTIKACESANIGDVGTINGVQYTVVDREMLMDKIQNGEDVTKVCTTRITDMSALFYLNGQINDIMITFNQPIGNWDVSNVISMTGLLALPSFNQPIENWDVSNVLSMAGMFSAANEFNQDISSWNVSNVVNMEIMFSAAFDFNQDISSWNVSNVIHMAGMFLNAVEFNQDLSNWNVSNVTDMYAMFSSANEFNQDISSWNVSNVVSMHYMFLNAVEFNQDLSNWSVGNVTECEEFSNNTPQWTLPQPNFTNCNPN